jgi:hypothetical protein
VRSAYSQSRINLRLSHLDPRRLFQEWPQNTRSTPVYSRKDQTLFSLTDRTGCRPQSTRTLTPRRCTLSDPTPTCRAVPIPNQTLLSILSGQVSSNVSRRARVLSRRLFEFVVHLLAFPTTSVTMLVFVRFPEISCLLGYDDCRRWSNGRHRNHRRSSWIQHRFCSTGP